MASSEVVPPLWTNCAHVNHQYPHGIGRVDAHDHTSGHHPVTDFKRSNSLYATAMHWHPGLDTDKDHIACEHL